MFISANAFNDMLKVNPIVYKGCPKIYSFVEIIRDYFN